MPIDVHRAHPLRAVAPNSAATARLPSVKRRSPHPARAAGLNGAWAAPPVLAAAALAGVFALSGCQVMSPVQTNVPYQPADGVAVDLGDVHIRDLVVVAASKGEVGTLSALVVNNGTKPVTVTFAAGANGDSATAVIPAAAQTRLSGVPGTTPVTLRDIPTAPGGIILLTVSTPSGGAPQVSVPVLLPDGYYSTIPPAPALTPAPTQSATP